jgi:hypothetical protein
VRLVAAGISEAVLPTSPQHRPQRERAGALSAVPVAEDGAAIAPFTRLSYLKEDHVNGFDSYHSEHWRIVPMVRPSKDDRDLIRLADANFKREFTQQMETLRLSATTPPNCKVLTERNY